MTMHRADANTDGGRRQIVLAGLTAPLWLPHVAGEVAAQLALSDRSGRQKSDLVMTIVYDNYPGRKGWTPHWGFACVIRGLEKTILFDTGGVGRILLANLRQSNVDIEKIDAVVLSHIHGDHKGGLSSVAMGRTGLPVYVPTGFPTAWKKQVQSLGALPIETAESKQICHGARTTGTLGQEAIAEHGLCVESDEGWVLITGCAHAGVDNMVARAKTVTAGPIRLVFGGFHMGVHSKSEANAVLDRLEHLGVERVAPCHCTSDEARELFKERFGDRCELAHLGSVFQFRSPGREGP